MKVSDETCESARMRESGLMVKSANHLGVHEVLPVGGSSNAMLALLRGKTIFTLMSKVSMGK